MNELAWNEAKILQMIEDGVEESLHLDYKASGSLAKTSAKREEIIKDVTSFANSDGGVIIYGVREHTSADKKHLPADIDPINRMDFSKEWLEHVISNVSPRIPSLRIYPIAIANSDTKCVYVVEIPKGETAHQATDGRYYRRYNFESTFMRDHEVRDVMNRIKAPRVDVCALIVFSDCWDGCKFMLKIKNVSTRIALNYSVSVKMPLKIKSWYVDTKDKIGLLENDEFGHYHSLTIGNEITKFPLFPKASVILEKELIFVQNSFEFVNGDTLQIRKFIDVTVYADEMEPVSLKFDPQLLRSDWCVAHGEPNSV